MSTSFAQELEADDRLTISQHSKPYIGVYAFAYQGSPSPGYPQFQLNNYGGTKGSEAVTADYSVLGAFQFSGHDGSAKKTVGVIRVKTMEDFATSFSSRMDFLIGANRQQRMTILGDTGNVGIGTATPESRLDVNGKIRMQEGAMEGYIPVSDSMGVMTWTDPNTFIAPDLWETSNGSDIYRAAGSVGIGTTTPLYYTPLHVNSTNGATAILESSSTNNYLTFKTNGTNGYVGVWSGDDDMDFGTDLGNYTGSAHIVTNASPKLTVVADGKVGIGTQIPSAQFDVQSSTNNNVIQATVNYSGDVDVVAINATSFPALGMGYGVNASGGYLGVRGVGSAVSYSGAVYGVSGYASGSGGGRYGILGDADGGTSNYAGYFIGNVNVTGTFTNPSDRKLKENVESYTEALEVIRQLEAKTYDYKKTAFEEMGLSNQNQIGFIAQEVEKILPNLVSNNVHPEKIELDEEGNRIVLKEAIDYKGINYVGLIPVLSQGIKELTNIVSEKEEIIETMKQEMISMIQKMEEMTTLINTMNDKFNQMEEDMSSCCMNVSDSRTTNANTNVQLNRTDMAILEQNTPNPFSEQTIIKYYIPSFAQKATMTITDIKGSPLKSLTLENTGLGTVIINANELPIGTYIYTLFVDGRQVESKQMILVK